MPRIKAPSVAAHHELMWAALINALADLMGRHDYHDIALADIAVLAGMARNTIYNYAKNKDVLFAVAAEQTSRGAVDQIASAARAQTAASERIAGMVRILLESFTNPVTRYAVLRALSEPAEPVRPDWAAPFIAVRTEFDGVIRSAIAEGEFRALSDVPFAIELLAAMTGVAARRIAAGDNDIDRLAEMVSDFMLRALLVD